MQASGSKLLRNSSVNISSTSEIAVTSSRSSRRIETSGALISVEDIETMPEFFQLRRVDTEGGTGLGTPFTGQNLADAKVWRQSSSSSFWGTEMSGANNDGDDFELLLASFRRRYDGTEGEGRVELPPTGQDPANPKVQRRSTSHQGSQS